LNAAVRGTLLVSYRQRHGSRRQANEKVVMTNAINLAALGAGGFDTTALVNGLAAAQQQPLNQLNTQQQNIQSAQTTLSGFSTTMSALKTAALALSDPAGFSSTKATSSDASVVATAGAKAGAGQWTVSVTSIAQEQRTLSPGTISSTTALGLSGNLGIALGSGAGTGIALSSTDTLSDIAGKIATSGLRLQSSIVYDGSNYHLLVSGLDTGSANTVTFDESSLVGTTPLGLSKPASTIQAAQNANLTVGGIPITSPTNQITNAIPGVTIAVTQPTTSPATIQIASDPTAVQTKVQSFVTAYNAVVKSGHSATGFAAQKASNTLLQGDQAIRLSLNRLGSLMGQTVAGTSGKYTNLASAGVALSTDGTLTLDSTKLASALSADPTSVERLFVTDAATGSQGIMATVGSTIDSITTNHGAPLKAETDGFATRIKDISKRITAMQLQSTAYQKQLTTTFAQMNTTLALYKTMAASLNFGSGNNSNGTNNVL
jgi:flagellar hook-associated protein 2